VSPLVPSAVRRIFIVGFPRSGTTLVQSLLASHTALTSFTETHFFSRHFSRTRWLPGPLLVRDPGPRLREFLAENGVPRLSDTAARLCGEGRSLLRASVVLPFRTAEVARQLLLVLDDLAVRRGRSGWVEKTPLHLHYLPFLERVSAPGHDTHFVHVIREGVAAATSLHRASQAWERPYDLEASAFRWNEEVALSLRRCGRLTDHFVFYEELTDEPEAVLRPLLSALGLDWEPAVIERYGGTSARLTTTQEPWKAETSDPIRRSRAADETLAPADRALIQRWLRPALYDALRAGARRAAPGVERLR
jgi:Sulfotransferase family